MATFATGNTTGGQKKGSGVCVAPAVAVAWDTRVRSSDAGAMDWLIVGCDRRDEPLAPAHARAQKQQQRFC